MDSVPHLPAEYHLTIVQGDDLVRTFAPMYYDLATSSLKLLDTTGYTARMKVRADYSSAAVLDCTTANGRLVVGIQGTAPRQWSVMLSVGNAVTAALTDWGMGVFDLELIDTFGKVSKLVAGTCCLQREVTY